MWDYILYAVKIHAGLFLIHEMLFITNSLAVGLVALLFYSNC